MEVVLAGLAVHFISREINQVRIKARIRRSRAMLCFFELAVHFHTTYWVTHLDAPQAAASQVQKKLSMYFVLFSISNAQLANFRP